MTITDLETLNRLVTEQSSRLNRLRIALAETPWYRRRKIRRELVEASERWLDLVDAQTARWKIEQRKWHP